MQLPFAVRSLGQALFRNVHVRVKSGLNEGMKWSIVTSGRGYGSGSFGRERIDVLRAVVRPGDCVWDVGAHKGFMSLAAARLVGPSGSVIAVEPAATNRWFLHHHLEWNGIDTVTVVPVALSGERGEAAFGGRGDSLAYELGTGDEIVAVRTLTDLVEEDGLPPPDVLKIDAEGQEAAILDAGAEAIGEHAALLVSVHGREMHEACTRILGNRDFRIFESWEMARCSADPEALWTSDYDLLAVGPQRAVDVEALSDLPLFRTP